MGWMSERVVWIWGGYNLKSNLEMLNVASRKYKKLLIVLTCVVYINEGFIHTSYLVVVVDEIRHTCRWYASFFAGPGRTYSTFIDTPSGTFESLYWGESDIHTYMEDWTEGNLGYVCMRRGMYSLVFVHRRDRHQVHGVDYWLQLMELGRQRLGGRIDTTKRE